MFRRFPKGAKVEGGLVAAALVALSLAATEGSFAGEKETTDPAVTDAVEDELVFDRSIFANDIDVRTEDGIVHLIGIVDNLRAKERAERIAETVRGVRSVSNRIRVVPIPPRTDWEIEKDVEAGLRQDRATESWEIDVLVSDGKVQLVGPVDSWQEKRLAGKVASGVRGVRAVDNDITVRFDEKRADEEIEADIDRRLHWSVLVDDAMIDVTVDDGEVSLTGIVGSAAEKRQARRLAWVANVESVDVSNLEVKWWWRDERLRENKYVDASPAEVERAIGEALAQDPRVRGTRLSADFEDGQAILRGTVDHVRAKRSAAQVARNTIGVRYVENRIKVRPGEPDDAKIEKYLGDALARNPHVERHEIDVDVVNGVARLSGTVVSYFEKGEADDIAARTTGVKEVRNDIDVEHDRIPIAYDPFLHDIYPYDYGWYDYQPYETFRTDEEIREEIRDQIWWSPFVDAKEVKVTVEDGRARLTGTVDTWSEKAAATESAYEGGAVWVDNDLEVAGDGGRS
jgi:osmotically-inducible protein OsmY